MPAAAAGADPASASFGEAGCVGGAAAVAIGRAVADGAAVSSERMVSATAPAAASKDADGSAWARPRVRRRAGFAGAVVASGAAGAAAWRSAQRRSSPAISLACW
ncbi:MAG: hypothetical protein KIS83_09345 [Rubrivivax sp.]|nr:hypothetical protein [Rubrivivax sp.]